MNWIRENKFMTGFIAVVVIGTGVLGYLLYSAYGAYADITDQYNAAASSLGQLQQRVPYPDQGNLKKYQAERDGVIASTGDLANTLSGMVLPVEQLTPYVFQDRLRDTIAALKTKAGKTGVKLPDNFALDFTTYQSQPPPAAAAGLLGRQLAAINIAMNILVDEHVDAISDLHRELLPQENGGGAQGEGGRNRGGFGGGGFGGGGGGRRGEGGEGGLVEKYPFTIKFIAGQAAFQKVLNDFAASNKQFFITRALSVNNSDPKPVAKAQEGVPGAGGAPAAPAQPSVTGTDTSGGMGYLKFLVGTEKLGVTMRVEMVTFNPPPAHH